VIIMPYRNRIRTLEESYRMVQSQIEKLEPVENADKKKLSELYEYREKYLTQLREYRRAQYDEDQRVDFDDR